MLLYISDGFKMVVRLCCRLIVNADVVGCIVLKLDTLSVNCIMFGAYGYVWIDPSSC
jgi:hypothetical protein